MVSQYIPLEPVLAAANAPRLLRHLLVLLLERSDALFQVVVIGHGFASLA